MSESTSETAEQAPSDAPTPVSRRSRAASVASQRYPKRSLLKTAKRYSPVRHSLMASLRSPDTAYERHARRARGRAARRCTLPAGRYAASGMVSPAPSGLVGERVAAAISSALTLRGW